MISKAPLGSLIVERAVRGGGTHWVGGGIARLETLRPE
tara:strand:+ start:383 stop:496 length:114 start_codon:yes stop_codon:yes gene_type:complete